MTIVMPEVRVCYLDDAHVPREHRVWARSEGSEVYMDKFEKIARAMALADGNDPDQPLAGYRRIIGKTVPVFRYDPKLSAWNYYVPLTKLFIAASSTLKEQ
jgi:hypothetical protein